jgi:hypothetical protein
MSDSALRAFPLQHARCQHLRAASLHRTPDYAAALLSGTQILHSKYNINDTDLRLYHLYWLELADGFQTSDQHHLAKIEKDIQDVRSLLDKSMTDAEQTI